jgi:single-strand DNA-binding protein
MSIYAEIQGCAGADPIRSTTRTGGSMTRLGVAADVTESRAETSETVWVQIFAFGALAEKLALAQKGAIMVARGRLTRRRYLGREGERRESWAVVADAVQVLGSAKGVGLFG